MILCSFSVFDFRKHGNSRYGSPYDSPRSQRSSQGKLEKSFLSFQTSYPSWEPNAEGKQFLQNLRTFREQKLSGHVNRQGFSPLRTWRGSPNMRSNLDNRNRLSRDMSNSTFATGNHLGSLWFIEANNQNNHPYLLDWYYTSGPRNATSRDVPTDPFEETRHPSRDWMPSNLTRNEPEYEEYINTYHDDRTASHFGASTSAPIFKESIIQDQDSNDLHHPTRSHWWARSHHQEGGHGQTSFFEPPNFNHERPYNIYNDKLSDIGSEHEDQEQDMYWSYHKSSDKKHIDNLESGEYNLHFDDIYSRPPENSTVNPNTTIF